MSKFTAEFTAAKNCEYELRPLLGFKILLNETLTPSLNAVKMSGEVKVHWLCTIIVAELPL